MLKQMLLTGVMSLGFGLTSAQAAQQVEEKEKPVRVSSVVVEKKDVLEQYPTLKKPNKEVPVDELLRELNEAKEREIREHDEYLRKQFIESERKRIEQERLARIEQERVARIERERVARIERERQERIKRVEHERQERIERESEQRKPDQTSTQQSKPVTTSEQAVSSLNIEFTYYTALCDSGCTGITATGLDVRNTTYYQGMRIIAVDPGVIPLYSIVRFELNGMMVKAIALDKGGHIKGNRIDMLVSSEREASALGRGTKRVEILRLGDK